MLCRTHAREKRKNQRRPGGGGNTHACTHMAPTNADGTYIPLLALQVTLHLLTLYVYSSLSLPQAAISLIRDGYKGRKSTASVPLLVPPWYLSLLGSLSLWNFREKNVGLKLHSIYNSIGIQNAEFFYLSHLDTTQGKYMNSMGVDAKKNSHQRATSKWLYFHKSREELLQFVLQSRQVVARSSLFDVFILTRLYLLYEV